MAQNKNLERRRQLVAQQLHVAPLRHRAELRRLPSCLPVRLRVRPAPSGPEVERCGDGSALRVGKVRRKEGSRGTWESVKDAVKDAWHRITGQHDVDTDKMAEFEEDRIGRGGRTF